MKNIGTFSNFLWTSLCFVILFITTKIISLVSGASDILMVETLLLVFLSFYAINESEKSKN